MKRALTIPVPTSYAPLKRTFLLCFLSFLVFNACTPPPPSATPTVEPLPAVIIVSGRACQLAPGETMPMVATGVSGSDVSYSWSATAGNVNPPAGPTVSYTAPDIAGDVIIRVAAERGRQTSEGTITCKVIAAPVTPTLTLAPATSAPTVLPAPPDLTAKPIACNHPSVTKNVFPQLEKVESERPFYGPPDDENFVCQAVFGDSFPTDAMAVRLEYKNVGQNYGFWGIETPPELTEGFSLAGFKEICFSAYVESPAQAFKLRLRDKLGAEKAVSIIIDQAGQWMPFCTQLSDFSDQGVNLERLQNFNLGFDQPSGSATVWVDNFLLR